MRNRWTLWEMGGKYKGLGTGRKKKRIWGEFTGDKRKLYKSGKDLKKVFINQNYQLCMRKNIITQSTLNF